MEAYLPGSVATTNDSTSPLGMNSIVSPTPNNWLSWGKIMPVDPLDTQTTATGGIDVMGGMGGMGMMGGMDGLSGMGGLASAYGAMAWTNWLGSVPADKKVTAPEAKGAGTSLFLKDTSTLY